MWTDWIDYAVKVTGENLYVDKVIGSFLDFIGALNGVVAVVVGGGDQIDEAIVDVFPSYVMDKRAGGRHLGNESPDTRKTIRDIQLQQLSDNRGYLREKLAGRMMQHVRVDIPVGYPLGIPSQNDGDLYLLRNFCNISHQMVIVTFDEETRNKKIAAYAEWRVDYGLGIFTPADIEQITEQIMIGIEIPVAIKAAMQQIMKQIEAEREVLVSA